MFYNVKVVNGSTSTVYPCAYFEVKIVSPESQAASVQLCMGDDGREFEGILSEPGIYLELCPHGPNLQLPRDGDTVFVTTSDKGKTIDTYRWPLRTAAEAEAARQQEVQP